MKQFSFMGAACRLAGLMYLAIVPAAVLAADKPESSVWFTLSGDSANTTEGYLELNLGLRSGSNLVIGAGSGRLKSTLATHDTETWLLGWNGKSGKWRYGIEYEVWQESGAIGTDTARFKFGWQGDKAGIFIHPEYRVTEFYLLNGQKRDFDSKAWGMSFNYAISDNWELHGKASKYSYNVRPQVLSLPVVALFISRRALFHRNGILDRTASMGLSYNQDNYSLGMELAESKSAVDGGRSRTLTFSYETYRSEPWVYRIEAGLSRTVGSGDEDTFIGFGVGYYWK